MKLAVSNIAWTVADDGVAHAMLRELGVSALEIAPTRFWPDLAAVSESQAREKAVELSGAGVPVCAFQALLFGKPDLQLFAPDGGRAMLDHLRIVIRLAGWMGARALVFGSPKNRRREGLDARDALARAVAFFREAGDAAAEKGVVICLEPNPPAYGADFMTTVAEAAEVVRDCDSPGVGLNLDMGELILNGTDAGGAVAEFLPMAGHFHISEPMLEPFDAARPAHRAAAASLRSAGYDGVASVEMKTPAGGLSDVRAAIAAIKTVYCT